MAQQGIEQWEMVANAKCKWTKFAATKLSVWEAPRKVMPVQKVTQHTGRVSDPLDVDTSQATAERGNQRPGDAFWHMPRSPAVLGFAPGVRTFVRLKCRSVYYGCTPSPSVWLLSEWCQRLREREKVCVCVCEVFVLKSVGVFRNIDYILCYENTFKLWDIVVRAFWGRNLRWLCFSW